VEPMITSATPPAPEAPMTIIFTMVAVQAVVIVGAALLQVFSIAVPLYLMSTLAFGVMTPIRQAWLNARRPSAQRATVISLDSLFLDAGGAVGQVGLGSLSRAMSIPMAWIVGGAIHLIALPFILRAGRAEVAHPAVLGPAAGVAAAGERATADATAAPAEPLPAEDMSRPLCGERVCWTPTPRPPPRIGTAGIDVVRDSEVVGGDGDQGLRVRAYAARPPATPSV